MSLSLVRPWLRAFAGRRAWIALPVGALLAALLALDPVVGPEDGLGSYLAYAALFPAVLLLRFGALLDARRRDGLELEEALRDPTGRRAPLAAILAPSAALGVGLALCAIPPAFANLPPGIAETARHPIRVAATGDGTFRADAGGAVPHDSVLLLTFEWERPARANERPALVASDGREVALVPGELARWPASAAEARRGVLEWGINSDARAAGITLLRPLARIAVSHPRRGDLPLLLARLFLFFWPLFPLVLLLVRRGRSGGVLAACAALALGGLAAADPHDPPDLPSSPVGWIGRAVLELKDLLPDVRGLASAGRGFELRSGTTSAAALAAWLGLGVILALASSGRRRPR
jgi:hypothetical protein